MGQHCEAKIVKTGVKTEAEILPKYPQTYFSLGRLDMARGPRHPRTAFSNFLLVNGKAYVILKISRWSSRRF